ncbi:hypothetical protein OPV22_011562 [Ensete ventricosum]|uniref:Secreted protein n=1 Tax=Ensete ventricosum TaxID=4639 RepID=A0AAV8PXQ5_ENSVE|nr:hypothetical protein OPV22_011562 [Ensete ventricosum]
MLKMETLLLLKILGFLTSLVDCISRFILLVSKNDIYYIQVSSFYWTRCVTLARTILSSAELSVDMNDGKKVIRNTILLGCRVCVDK